ncbi:hypothetical protein KJ596_04325 [Patescibacteria group bacterium]|nr:hypothetical protein [Patescibacteria group bacterium]MBU1868311.1 hypothetical protein [Patescibacteria group bacterium]
MKMKTYLMAALAFMVLAAGTIWVRGVYAETDGTGQTIVDRLTETFNLNEDEVETVFEEARQERFEGRRQEMRAKMEQGLGEAVNDNVITEDQRQSILDKQEEMMVQREQLREDWKTWAEASGIDFDQLREYRIGHFGGEFGGRGFGGGGCRGW